MFSGWVVFLAFGFGALCAAFAIGWVRVKEFEVISKDREKLFVEFLKENQDGKSN